MLAGVVGRGEQRRDLLVHLLGVRGRHVRLERLLVGPGAEHGELVRPVDALEHFEAHRAVVLARRRRDRSSATGSAALASTGPTST